jgi:hypothetical protein
VFYEIFDHFGPQYGWWTWNYPNFTSSLASVPVSSMVSFAFVGPIALTLATQLLVPKSVLTQNAPAMPGNRGVRGFALGTLLAGLLTPIIFVLLTLNTWFSVLGIDLTPRLEMLASVAIVGTAAGLTLRQFLRLTSFSTEGLWHYSRAYFVLFLSVFFGLWLYALPDYLAATEGLTKQGLPIGSLPYVMGCMVFALFFLFRTRR